MPIGYKWVRNRWNDVFIIELSYEFCEPDTVFSDGMAYKTNDCTVLSVTRLRDGKKFPCIMNGGAFRPFPYVVGKRITNEWIYFCPNMKTLYKCQGFMITMHQAFHRGNLKKFEDYKRLKKNNTDPFYFGILQDFIYSRAQKRP